MTDLIHRNLLTTDELARILKVKKSYLYELTYRHQIPYIKLGRFLRFDPEQIQSWLESKSRKPEDIQTLKSLFPDGGYSQKRQ